jgi:hypothetical protein
MTDFWQGQRPWFAPENLDRREHRENEHESPADSASQPERPRREPADELMQRAIQRAYDR